MIGAATLVGYWLWRHRGVGRVIKGSDAALVAILGVMLYAAVPAMQFVGLWKTEAVAFNFVFQAGIPLVLALSAGTILRERTTWWEWVGVGLVVLGSWVFFPTVPTGADATGVGLAALAAVFIGASNLIQRRVLRSGENSVIEVTTFSMVLGAVLLSIVALLSSPLPQLDLRLWLLLLVLGVLNTAVAFFIWHRAIQTLRALQIGVIASTQLIVVPLLATWILDEPFGPGRALGSVIVLVGVAVVHYSRAWAARTPRERSGRLTSSR